MGTGSKLLWHAFSNAFMEKETFASLLIMQRAVAILTLLMTDPLRALSTSYFLQDLHSTNKIILIILILPSEFLSGSFRIIV
jgi:hypothetical protein